jgi:hypothetical protein
MIFDLTPTRNSVATTAVEWRIANIDGTSRAPDTDSTHAGTQWTAVTYTSAVRPRWRDLLSPFWMTIGENAWPTPSW